MTDRELRLYNALKLITAYMQPAELQRKAEKLYGLEYGEALEMAYENVLQTAKDAIKGMRRPAAAIRNRTDEALKESAATPQQREEGSHG